MKETLSVSAASSDNEVNAPAISTESKPLTFVRVAVQNPENELIQLQVRMRDVADRGVVLGD